MSNLGNIRKKSYATEFVVVSNKIAQDNDLSWAEKGMILFLTSLSENWVIHKSNLHNYSSNGIDATRTTFDSLVKKGYIKSRRVSNDKGQFIGWEHIFDIERFGLTDTDQPENEETYSGNPDIVFSNNGEPNNIKEIDNKEISKKEKERKETYIAVSSKRVKKAAITFEPPTMEEVKSYFTENGFDEAKAVDCFNYYTRLEWCDKNGAKIKNWKLKVTGIWFTDQNKAKEKHPDCGLIGFDPVKANNQDYEPRYNEARTQVIYTRKFFGA
jgi:hypothetical protein